MPTRTTVRDLIGHLGRAVPLARRASLTALADATTNEPRGLRPGSRPPVCAQLGSALDLALAGACGEATRALLPLLEGAEWRQNATYAGRVGPDFLANYAYAELIGPAGRWSSATAAMGVLLLGADTRYPAHAHPADEDYLVLTSGASYEVGERRHVDLPAGATVRIPSETPHAMTTGPAPLLALYLWTGEIDQPARLLEVTP